MSHLILIWTSKHTLIIKSCYFHPRNTSKNKSGSIFPGFRKTNTWVCFLPPALLQLPVYQSVVTRWQLVQNTAACFWTKTNRRAHITPSLASLHWLPIKFRIDFKILLITFKAQHGLAPTYILQLLTPCNPSHNLRSASLSLLAVPRSRLATQGSLGQACEALELPARWDMAH